ncbi:hypothetical protein EDD18DRAFT_1106219 [Armillaria luteobubalina]|uniref:Uncharacterized protein n=1 Tax=Armillaria luteobubalina TaxID=153913 RepID=A0AA39Q5J3_9AGAR|nr:hypothetical protein EDD18DRAFT_1106219 [Armillaria luteobubalina]
MPIPSKPSQPTTHSLDKPNSISMLPAIAKDNTTLNSIPNVFAAQMQQEVATPEGWYQGPIQPNITEGTKGEMYSEGKTTDWGYPEREVRESTLTEPALKKDPCLLAIPAVSPALSKGPTPLHLDSPYLMDNNELSSEESRYESLELLPPSSYNSILSYPSEDSNAYSPLSLEELTWVSLKSNMHVVEPVCLSHNTLAALEDQPNEPQYFAC